ncbi:MAG: hypothetical protein HC880_05305 [Bacteroidia bacterium]|nr:hypothetical protein [Bacteroidia bacterium]
MVEFIQEFWHFLRERKKFWLIPLMLILFIIGLLVVVSSGSVLTPFIYSIF